jgi:hypothetical protein
MYLNREKRAALAIANEVRQDYGYPKRRKLSKGRRKDNTSCPIANTINEDLGASVSAESILVKGKHYQMPVEAAVFIISFDSRFDHQELSVTGLL